jgi:hypothetical protein
MPIKELSSHRSEAVRLLPLRRGFLSRHVDLRINPLADQLQPLPGFVARLIEAERAVIAERPAGRIFGMRGVTGDQDETSMTLVGNQPTPACTI